MKRSKLVVLLAPLALTGCGDDVPVTQSCNPDVQSCSTIVYNNSGSSALNMFLLMRAMRGGHNTVITQRYYSNGRYASSFARSGFGSTGRSTFVAGRSVASSGG